MLIEIFVKEKFDLKARKKLAGKLSHFSGCVSRAQEGRLYFIDGDYSKEETEKIAKEVLCDFITEDFFIGERKISGFKSVRLWLKDSITDVIAESVGSAIFDAGFKKPKKVKTGRVFYLKTNSKTKAVETVKKTFLNELLHKIESD